MTVDDLVARARRLIRDDRRALLGIAGAPGAGKTTLALALVEALGPEAVHVPMDGFHLADVELERLGRRDRKGAPDTFDAGGYAALLARLRVSDPPSGTIYAPAFDREIEQPIAGSIPVASSCRLVVSEGNYLLVDDPAWRAVRARFDEVWFHGTDEVLRRMRLVERHVRFGKSRDEAVAWVEAVDEPNARLIETTRPRADLVVTEDGPTRPEDR
ncbi:nucleoside/nucleotide kinase family protein [Actinomycetospora sp. NBRC 106378]|uniref:nucleoside/nucleotide kinase family protein n=1 Tax=Actinomycetospora sp. NBRC 106378 TaxID=3032208 RepID=UPI0024A55AF0|nr:nucleoside/nucleotide kinase family protein [Actinomycetospora sp. NBRC 106378]GLZ55932.1 nucleoside/nucleotide kinase family protein [Actinomycetospora sp. NBRC 106378]